MRKARQRGVSHDWEKRRMVLTCCVAVGPMFYLMDDFGTFEKVLRAVTRSTGRVDSRAPSKTCLCPCAGSAQSSGSTGRSACMKRSGKGVGKGQGWCLQWRCSSTIAAPVRRAEAMSAGRSPLASFCPDPSIERV
ncbi:hypothetical protein IE81DRAFT_112373 [Ceraceosorus guamensis]|uniref:Uncharacterized protein n=1 Tax=Ceraceosorus guamensis TaxID=1522189 RepID=A0A316W2V3_9BASI|nr:hypothetical protein IE81DRAFT_112373 [Ceraceosorus guamensis]PWN42911.1 hypothetical protein IE81DRAFT_112373 [Ceraceosorus guamensis]